MKLILTNYDQNYEIEQLSRMFFRPLEVIICQKRPADTGDEFVYIRRFGGGKFFLHIAFNGKKLRRVFTPDTSGETREMQLCLEAYKLYTQVTGKNLPWGVLTGVRPVRLLRNLTAKLGSLDAAQRKMSRDYLVSDKKLQLCSDIYTLQKDLCRDCSPKDYSLYISIPFCPSRCSYCSFVSTSVKSSGHLMEGYVDKLCMEIAYTAQKAQRLGMNLKTVYIGGGTPTAITAPMLEKVMKTVAQCFDLSSIQEYTVEAGRPDCTDRQKLEIIKAYGAKRVSINPQTFSDKVLKAIGRSHSHRDFLRCFETARNVGFDSINTDLIAGLPEDTVDSFENSLKGCIRLGAENITVHTLTLKRASNLVINHRQYTWADVEQMIEKTSLLYTAGYRPYYMYRQKATVENLENVGFSQVGHESLYNIYIMEELQTIISCGCGGVSKIVGGHGQIKRIANYKYPNEYITDFSAIIKRKDEVFSQCLQFGFQND